MQTTISTTNQGGGAVASVLTEPLTERDLDYSRLERTVDRYQLLLLAKRVGKEGGFTPRMLQLLEYYLAYTTAVDWEEGSRPIVFQSLARTAMDLGVGERQIQKLEKRLFDVGAIAWNDSGNHKRFGRRDPRTGSLMFAYGVDLTPLASLKNDLEAKLHEKQLYAEAWRATKREISETRRRIRDLLSRGREEGADGELMLRFEQSYREIAIELRSHLNLVRLRHLATLHRKLHTELNKALGAGRIRRSSQPKPSTLTAPTTPESSCRHAQKVAHQEHTTPGKKRRAEAEEAGAAKRASGQPYETGSAIGRITLPQLVRCASNRFREHLPLCERPLGWSEVIEAAYQTRSDLRISQAGWAEACIVLGRIGAALCVLLTDHATERCDNPVRYPAAYFRGLVQKARRGELRLERSIDALRRASPSAEMPFTNTAHRSLS